ncbi:TPA: IS66 family transposase [Salmonella enterica]|uniref:IS66 family transposase n=1 Tax=Salmonella enterica TaxID=28901 RepID=A0A742RLE1_SALER|nr:IS66 family transposase [Salmonella enterica]HAF2207208.1 IS66 family transposase [Salmonella enterica]HAF2376624.1 IS66 family transposase [Salmonella enterica]HAF2572405.1 IS66 family transposase [Salmonella enterica]HAG4669176.1 IS66 family transposase [Salmonella enterica]
MNKQLHARLAELEKLLIGQAEALRQKDTQFRLIEETETFLRTALARAEDKVEEGEREIERLRAQLEKLRRMLFGTRSEKLRRQVEEAEALLKQQEHESDRYSGRETDPQVPRQLRQSRHRRPFPEHLPREINRLEPVETCCPGCGGELDFLGEVSAEQLELVTSALKVIRTVRVKKACTKCDCIVEAPAPSRPIERGIAGQGLLARVMTAKFCEHTPLYRLSEILERQHGVVLSRVLLSNWIDACCRLLSAVVDELYQYVMNGRKVYVDDTPVKVLAPGTKKTKKGHIWVYVRDDRNAGSSDPPAVWYAYSPDWSGKHTHDHLRHFHGVLQCDVYKGYEALFSAEREGGPLMEAACMAHARRGINDVWEPARTSATAEEALSRIGELYAIEKEIRGLPEAERLRVRQNRSKPLLLALYDWMEEKVASASRKDRLPTAFQYLLNRKEALAYFCEDGLAEIDNNAAERALRSVCLGKKNWLFFGNDHGGDRGAMVYSLIETCKLNGINPEAYLRYVLSVLPEWPANRVNELLPWNVELSSK